MTTVLDTKILPKVLAILAKYGKTVTFTVSTNAQASFNPATGEAIPTTTDYTVKCSPPEPYDSRYIDGDIIKIGDAKTIIAASGLTFAPVLGMSVAIDSAKWTVVDLAALFSGDLIAAYEMRIRK